MLSASTIPSASPPASSSTTVHHTTTSTLTRLSDDTSVDNFLNARKTTNHVVLSSSTPNVSHEPTVLPVKTTEKEISTTTVHPESQTTMDKTLAKTQTTSSATTTEASSWFFHGRKKRSENNHDDSMTVLNLTLTCKNDILSVKWDIQTNYNIVGIKLAIKCTYENESIIGVEQTYGMSEFEQSCCSQMCEVCLNVLYNTSLGGSEEHLRISQTCKSLSSCDNKPRHGFLGSAPFIILVCTCAVLVLAILAFSCQMCKSGRLFMSKVNTINDTMDNSSLQSGVGSRADDNNPTAFIISDMPQCVHDVTISNGEWIDVHCKNENVDYKHV